jgi:hypothetical protein
MKVLRSSETISNNNIAQAEVIARLPYGVGSYEDTPPADGRYFYAVIGITSEGEEYPKVAIYRNTLLDAVVFNAPVDEEEPDTPSVVETPASPETETPLDPEPDAPVEVGFDVADIVLTGSPAENGMALEFQGNKSDRNYLLFRYTEIINSVQAVRSADLIKSFSLPTGAFLDDPPPGIPYFYAVVDASALNRGEGNLFLKELHHHGIQQTPGGSDLGNGYRQPAVCHFLRSA